MGLTLYLPLGCKPGCLSHLFLTGSVGEAWEGRLCNSSPDQYLVGLGHQMSQNLGTKRCLVQAVSPAEPVAYVPKPSELSALKTPDLLSRTVTNLSAADFGERLKQPVLPSYVG